MAISLGLNYLENLMIFIKKTNKKEYSCKPRDVKLEY